MIDKEQFTALTRRLVHGPLREAVGYTVESELPYFHGTIGFLVEAPMLWIRHSRFPILFVVYDNNQSQMLEAVVTQLQSAKVAEFFALLIVVPGAEENGREAEEVRGLMANSLYRYDFVVLDRDSLVRIIAGSNSRQLIEVILEQGIDLSSLSPYVVRGPVPEKMFFGREREIKEVSQRVLTADYSIVGGRRIGKSSILQRVNGLLNNDHRYWACYLDCEEKFEYRDLFGAMEIEFKAALDDASPLSFRKLVARLNNQSPTRQVVFLLDEVDELLDYDAHSERSGQLFKTFRALSQESACRFVFSGSRTLYQHLHNPKSPFFNFCEDIILKPLGERSIAEIVSKPMRQLGIQLPDEEALIDRIIELSSCHPSIAQWLCDRLIKTAPQRCITVESLEHIATDPEFCRYFVQTAWSDSTPLERLISLMVEGPTFGLDQLFKSLTRYRLDNKKMILESLEMLQLCSLVERNGQECRFVLAHFPQLVRNMEDVTSQIECLLRQVSM